MGMDADVIAIGPFSRDIADCLDYPSGFYKDTEEGSPVLSTLFLCNTSQASKELAEAFGIDSWDFNQHKLDDVVHVQTLAAINSEWEAIAEYNKFLRLKERGFEFYYRPNG